jgi:hypothetical protein
LGRRTRKQLAADFSEELDVKGGYNPNAKSARRRYPLHCRRLRKNDVVSQMGQHFDETRIMPSIGKRGGAK